FYRQRIPTTSKFSQVPAVASVQHYGGYNFKSGESCHDFDADYNKLLTQSWMETLEFQHDVATGKSNCMGFRSGARFELVHAVSSESGKYLLTEVWHQANNGADEPDSYRNDFQCVPVTAPIRPPRQRLKRQMPGPQTAKVMSLSASGSAADADPQRMVRVQFPWDSEHNSCKLRVLQGYAGSGWGASFVPREGQEVLVDFVNGDSDRPIVVGALYNKDSQGPKYTSTQSGWLTQSGNANELRFDDKGGAEEVYLKAGKDWNYVVANNETGQVQNAQSLTVSSTRTVTVGSDESKTIGANQTLAVTRNQTITLGNNKTETVAINCAETIGAAKELTIGGLYQVTVGAAMNETVAAIKAEEVGASRSLAVGLNMSENVGKNRSISVGNTSSHSAKKIVITAEDELTVKVGKATLVMKKDGSIALNGKDIEIKGSGKISVKASSDVVIKGSKVGVN
ncbi:MAG TPA: type VI secretion system tip protein TssI/VgrG, partial [Dongiaceae bacterium]|nr:type VI secretion system tip protein TssI/VgrG [Dongiaceae bacterium]